MENNNNVESCVNCGNSQNDTPILQFKFKGEVMGICSACMPVLIHKPEQFANRLANVAST